MKPAPTIQKTDDQNPLSVDFIIDQNWETRYTETSHTAWVTLLRSLQLLSSQTSCSKFMRGQEFIALDAERIPKFKDLTERLSTTTGWEIIGVNGFVPDEIFFTHIANKRFPMSCIIRSLDGSQFQDSPDLFHDVYGHVPLLMYPEVSNILQSSARGILKAIKMGRQDLVKKIAAAYWFTIEVGLVKERGSIRVYGAAVASSPKEIMFATADQTPNLIRFDLDRVMRTDFNYTDVQRTYFVLDEINDLKNLGEQDFFERALNLKNMPTLAEGEICASDEIIQLGTNHGSNG